MRRAAIIAVFTLIALSSSGPLHAEDGAFEVPEGEILLHRWEAGAVLGALPGATGRLLPEGLELTAGTAVLSWSGSFPINGVPRSCAEDRCQAQLGAQVHDDVTLHKFVHADRIPDVQERPRDGEGQNRDGNDAQDDHARPGGGRLQPVRP